VTHRCHIMWLCRLPIDRYWRDIIDIRAVLQICAGRAVGLGVGAGVAERSGGGVRRSPRVIRCALYDFEICGLIMCLVYSKGIPVHSFQT
jgi:hypothetical protein